MGVPFMHDFHSETCSVEDVCPGADNVSFRRLDGLVEVESIEIKGHGRYAKGGEPDAYYRECGKEEVQ